MKHCRSLRNSEAWVNVHLNNYYKLLKWRYCKFMVKPSTQRVLDLRKLRIIAGPDLYSARLRYYSGIVLHVYIGQSKKPICSFGHANTPDRNSKIDMKCRSKRAFHHLNNLYINVQRDSNAGWSFAGKAWKEKEGPYNWVSEIAKSWS